jgi:hypothetical protein
MNWAKYDSGNCTFIIKGLPVQLQAPGQKLKPGAFSKSVYDSVVAGRDRLYIESREKHGDVYPIEQQQPFLQYRELHSSPEREPGQVGSPERQSAVVSSLEGHSEVGGSLESERASSPERQPQVTPFLPRDTPTRALLLNDLNLQSVTPPARNLLNSNASSPTTAQEKASLLALVSDVLKPSGFLVLVR